MVGSLKVQLHGGVERQFLILVAVTCAQKPKISFFVHLADIHRTRCARSIGTYGCTEEAILPLFDEFLDLFHCFLSAQVLVILFSLIPVN